jgi:hypothetical protein
MRSLGFLGVFGRKILICIDESTINAHRFLFLGAD